MHDPRRESGDSRRGACTEVAVDDARTGVGDACSCQDGEALCRLQINRRCRASRNLEDEQGAADRESDGGEELGASAWEVDGHRVWLPSVWRENRRKNSSGLSRATLL